MRQIVLDTETTGIKVEEGHRVIEIGCVEMIDRKLTGNHFHRYINPEREVEAGALAVHGITNEFLIDKPLFQQIANELMDFISGAELIIHNAPFDLSFLNHELTLTRQGWKKLSDYCRVIDTLQLARQLHVGQRNSLDALCKRYSIDNSKRNLHGALLDAHLLAQVYLAMTGGQGSFFDALNPNQSMMVAKQTDATVKSIEKHNLVVLAATADELTRHEAYLQNMKQKGKCLWLDN
ncbi:DNA polymerase III subunit epsilon [Aquicella lusitana]|uniref:DNA polymerase III subunit epsilon n=1 Tax=Aquicella lusitana TaxID=254246 RepID=A0A370GQR7_9COXI|nr:DNA polymerase III subunit epsilon [Aquicella lusitana]RDI46062.1 DNA polymerase III epsilon subunit [Aquicella lusitana]VVC73341.1 DNA polymerase III subunit epsilon [Aquicella lusitana]